MPSFLANFLRRHPLAARLTAVFLAMLVAQCLGSVFNIWYNLTHIRPLLTPKQAIRFEATISIFNLIVYPVLLAVWARTVFRSLRRPGDREGNRRHVINLPWLATLIGGFGWFLCVPSFLTALLTSGERLDPAIYFHLPVSLAIGALIALTLSFLSIELLSQKLLYPFFFRDATPWDTPGAYSLTILGRGVFWAVSASLCPIVALLLLIVSPSEHNASFALAVAGICVAFGLVEAWLLGRLVIAPIEELRRAARRVQQGDLTARVSFLRADEFGILGHEFNRMVLGLQEKETIQERFGRYMGTEIAKELLTREDELGGVERMVTVLFSDIRGYTAFCERVKPAVAVEVLNRYHACMTEIIEGHGGMVTQIMGDGFLATFGATGRGAGDHAGQALAAGRSMLERLPGLNGNLEEIGIEPIHIGIGVHTGPAVVGTIGSPRRMEYTVVGATVNVASRIESLTKDVESPMLFSLATLEAAKEIPASAIELPPQRIRGKEDAIRIFALRTS